MKCSIFGCPGVYRPQLIVHTVRRGDEILVFENVPAEACDVCSDQLLAPDTIRHLEEMMRRDEKPEKQAPVYAYV
jgi:YgiT-type zinc finger domain-containing protein